MADMDEMIVEISVFSFRIIISAEPFTYFYTVFSN